MIYSAVSSRFRIASILLFFRWCVWQVSILSDSDLVILKAVITSLGSIPAVCAGRLFSRQQMSWILFSCIPVYAAVHQRNPVQGLSALVLGLWFRSVYLKWINQATRGKRAIRLVSADHMPIRQCQSYRRIFRNFSIWPASLHPLSQIMPLSSGNSPAYLRAE